MPFYLLDGHATKAYVNAAPATIAGSVGQQTVIWPNQSAAHVLEPTTVSWALGGITYRQQLSPHRAPDQGRN